VIVLLGRFQPFHKGHAAMVEEALNRDSEVTICIGSSEESGTLENPWTAEEREQMIRIWLGDRAATIVHIPDINDPPNYVAHAEAFHGKNGPFLTTDESTADLYRAADWDVILCELSERDDWHGWRVRATMQMLSTVLEEEAAIAALAVNVPESVARLIFDHGWQRRLFHFGTGGEPVG